MKKPINNRKAKNFTNLVKSLRIFNGCGGKQGTKCGVEVYYLPADSKLNAVEA